MVKPYYEDESVTLYNGRCEDVLPGLSLTDSVHLLTDPPYFKVKDNDWDNQWSKSAEFLDWMGEWLDLAKPHLTTDASVWVFASPKLTSAVESVVAQRFRVLNSIRWVKPQGWHMKSELAAARSFLSPWEGIIFAEMADGTYESKDYESFKGAFAASGEYLASRRRAAGLTRSDVGRALHAAGAYSSVGSAVANISLQEIGSRKLSPAAYAAWSSVVELKPYDELQADYEQMHIERAAHRAQYAHLRRTFTVRERGLSGDTWQFPPVAHYPGKHVCEKPVGLLTHMIETTTRPGDTILDCFAGSGAVLDVARQLGRRAVGIEMDEHWCEQAAKRLSDANRQPQAALDFGEWLA